MSELSGKPAFPVAWPAPNVPEIGMSLREYYAGQVLPVFVNYPLVHGVSVLHPGSPMHPQKAAKVALQYADALCAALAGDAA